MTPLKKPTTPRVIRKTKAIKPLSEMKEEATHEKQTSTENFHLLEELRRELEKGNQLNELRSDITRLENEKRNLEQQVQQLEIRLQAQNSQTAATIEALKNTIRGQVQSLDQQLQVFALDTSHTVEGMLAVLHSLNPSSSTNQPHIALDIAPQAHQVPSEPLQTARSSYQAPVNHQANPEPLFESIPEKSKDQLKPRSKVRRLVFRTFYAALVLGLLGGGYTYLRPSTEIYSDNQVAGVSTQPSSEPQPEGSSDPYAASFAEVDFDKTVWESVSDADFSISVKFPVNASTKVKVIGGNNLWFARKSTYLMRFTRNTTEETLEQWWTSNQAIYTEQNKATKITYKGKPAYYLESLEKTPTSGSSYVLKHKENILIIWVKDEPTTTDDGKRISEMTSSLTFTN